MGWEVTANPLPVLTPSTEALDRGVATTAGRREVRVFVKTIHSVRHWPNRHAPRDAAGGRECSGRMRLSSRLDLPLLLLAGLTMAVGRYLH
jgi:hypothetical protein